MTLDTRGLIAFALVLVAGIGGALGAVHLGAGELAATILAFAGGLLVPMPRLLGEQ
jgi:hypothetical protein